MLCRVLLPLAVCAAVGAAQPPAARVPTAPSVLVDDAATAALAEIDKLLEQNDRAGAAARIKAVLAGDPSGLMAAEETGLYIPLQAVLEDRLRRDAELRRAFDDLTRADAAARLRQLVDRQDLTGLALLAMEHPRTEPGWQAWAALGDLLLDRGRTEAACDAWQRALDACADGERPRLLARLAVGSRLCGRRDVAARWANQLRGCGEQPVVVAGRQTTARAVAESLQAELSPAVGAAAPAGPQALQLEWVVGDPAAAQAEKVHAPPADLKAWRAEMERIRFYGNKIATLADGDWLEFVLPGPSLIDGVVTLTQPDPDHEGSSPGGQIAAPQIHPLADAGRVYIRTDAEVGAWEAATGRKLWSSAFAVRRDVRPEAKKNSSLNPFHRYGGYGALDQGRYRLTLADGRLYALGGFFPSSLFAHRVAEASAAHAAEVADPASSLVALDARDGSPLWQVGRKGGQPNLARWRFLTTPAVAGEAVLTAAVLPQADIVLARLDAEDGSLDWSRTLVVGGRQQSIRFGKGVSVTWTVGDWAARPVVQGLTAWCVFTGGAAAVDVETGRWLWFRDTTKGPEAPVVDARGVTRKPRLHNTVQPFLCGEVLVCLPADRDEVLGLKARTGELVWKKPRHGAQWMVGLDGDRVLLAAPGLAVVSATDGAVLWESPKDCWVYGEPAVKGGVAVAAGAGRLWTLDLASYDLRSVPLPKGAEAVSGHVALGPGAIITANPLAVAGYRAAEPSSDPPPAPPAAKEKRVGTAAGD